MDKLHVFVSGRVQGVFFRAWTRNQAQRLGLSGWVRNVSDGRVEVMAQGEDGALRAFQELLGEGPPLSRVDAVMVTAPKDIPRKPMSGFEIISSA